MACLVTIRHCAPLGIGTYGVGATGEVIMPRVWFRVTLLSKRITQILAPPPLLEEQRVRLEEQRVIKEAAHENEQRVIDDEPILTTAPGIMTFQSHL